MTKYIKDKNGKFSGSLPDEPKLDTSKVVSDVPPLPVAAAPAVAPRNKNDIEWVVSMTLHDGTQIRGVQVAWYGHAAIDFFAKKHNVTNFKGASSEKKTHFDNFLAQGLRKPLDADSDGKSTPAATAATPVTSEAITSTPESSTQSVETAESKAEEKVATCEYGNCDGPVTDIIHWSTPINRAGKVLPSGQDPKRIPVCKGHYWTLTTALYGSD
jgi:hypothetical protein